MALPADGPEVIEGVIATDRSGPDVVNLRRDRRADAGDAELTAVAVAGEYEPAGL